MEFIPTQDGFRTSFGWASGDRPGELVFSHAVPTEICEAILNALANSFIPSAGGCHLQALAVCSHVVGRYQLTTPTGSYFIRVSSLPGHPELERALTGYLKQNGLPVNELLVAGAEVRYEGKSYRMDVRPFLPARHTSGSLAEFKALAEVLRDCHVLLRGFPGADEVKAISEARFLTLAETTRRLASLIRGDQFDELPTFFRDSAHRQFLERVARFSPLELSRDSQAQCVHGQIHQANVLFADHRPILLDFEESVHVYAPADWDVAHLVQRFCLMDEPSRELLAERLSIVEAFWGPIDSKLWERMREIAWFSILILIKGWFELRLEAPASEFEKFITFETQATCFEALLQT